MKRTCLTLIIGWLLLLCLSPIRTSAQIESRLSQRDSLWRAYLEEVSRNPYIMAEEEWKNPKDTIDPTLPLIITRNGKRQVLRGEEDKPQISLKTSKAVGEKLSYKIVVLANTSLDIDAGNGEWKTVGPFTAGTRNMQTDIEGDYVIIRGEGITTLDIVYQDVTQLDVSAYPSLKSLICNGNKVGTLDVSKLTGLTELKCAYMGISDLDLTGLTALRELTCSGNNLTTLDISGQTGLTRLDCSVNKLTTLDVSAYTGLTYLNCSENELTALDVTGLNNLVYLYCSTNKLKTLTLGSLPSLLTMNCEYNNLETLDASQCAVLNGLRCAFNELTQLTFPPRESLQYLSCTANKLTTLDVTDFGKLSTIYCSLNLLTALSVDGCVYLGELSCGGNKLTSLDLSGITNLHTFSCSNNELETLNLSHLTKLRNYLSCSTNKLKTIFFPAESNITHLYINNNEFESLDISLLSNLGVLDCSNNKLPSMNFLGNPKLYQIECQNNLLTTVDVTGLQPLRYFDCSTNLLTNISLGNNPALESIVCYDNYLYYSTLPEYNLSTYYGYFPQYPIDKQDPVDSSQPLDLSAELTCLKFGQPYTTLYKWYKVLASGKKVLIENGITGYEEGIFHFEEFMNGKKMVCEMRNNAFSELTVTFNYPGQVWEGSYNIVSVTHPSGVRVNPGVAVEDLPLPSKVYVELDDGYRFQIDVNWDTGSYDPQVQDTYTLDGTFVLWEGITNLNNLKTQLELVVAEKMYDGEGTPLSPYLISTHQQLDSVRHYLGRKDVYFKMINDIDLSTYDTDDDPSNGNWTPIGKYAKPFFCGHFDGGGYSIRNMYINLPNSYDLGLFAAIHGTVENLGMADAYIYGDAYIGILAGSLNQGTVTNCYATGMVKGYDRHIAGLVGYIGIEYTEAPCPVVFRNCYTRANVYGKTSVGGLVGFGAGDIDREHILIENCYAAGIVSADMEWEDYWVRTAGIFGSFVFDNRAVPKTRISNCVVMSPSVSGSTFENFVARIGNADRFDLKLPVPEGVFTNCYARTDLLMNGQPVVDGTTTNKDGANLTQEELLKKETYTDKLLWDFDNVWSMPEEGGYPILKKTRETFQEADLVVTVPDDICLGSDVILVFTSTLENPVFSIYSNPLKTEKLAEISTLTEGSYRYLIQNMPEKVDWYVTVKNVATPESKTVLLSLQTKAPPEIELNVSSTITRYELEELSLVASGEGNLTYQWYFNNEKIEGETDNTLSIQTLRKTHAGTYSVIASNGCSFSAMVSTTVTVKDAFTLKPTYYKAPAFSTTYYGEWSPSNVTVKYVANAAGITVQHRKKEEAGWSITPATLLLNENQDETYIFRAIKDNLISEEQSLNVRIDKVEPAFNLIALSGGEPYADGETATKPIVFTIAPQTENISGVTYTYCFFIAGQENKIPITGNQFTLDGNITDFLIVEANSGAGLYVSEFLSVNIELPLPPQTITGVPVKIDARFGDKPLTLQPQVVDNPSPVFSFSTTGTGVVTVDENGIVSFIGVGTDEIIITVAAQGLYEEGVIRIPVSVLHPLTPVPPSPSVPEIHMVVISLTVDEAYKDCIGLYPAAGTYEVEEGEDITIRVFLGDDCALFTPELFVNGERVEPDEESMRAIAYTYTIKVTAPLSIEIKGEQNPVNTESALSELKISVVHSQLYIYSAIERDVWIYTYTGQLYDVRKILPGTTVLTMRKGLYFLRFDKEVRKVIVY